MQEGTSVANRQKWPGLPRGVKFDPSDEEVLWHLLAEIGEGEAEPHPFIGEFIISLDDNAGFAYSFPHKLPGVKQDGSFSYFFHRSFKAHENKSWKCRKIINGGLGTVCWHKIGKTKPVYVDGIHRGSKQIMVPYMSMVDGEKPEKTNWRMHQYHVGIREDVEGGLVISKIFYQLKFSQGDMNVHDLCMGTLETVGAVTEPAVSLRLPQPKPYASSSNSISVEVLSQDVLMDYSGPKDARSSGEVYCSKAYRNMINEEEASQHMLNPSRSRLDTRARTGSLCRITAAKATCETSTQTRVAFQTSNMLDHSVLSGHATHVKVEPSDYMLENTCNEVADNISPAAMGTSELLCEHQNDKIDHVTLQERYKLMLSSMNDALGCQYNLENAQDMVQYASGFASYNRIHDIDTEVIPRKERHEVLTGHLETSYESTSAPQDSPFMSDTNGTEECFSTRVKDEIQHADAQFSCEERCLLSAQHDDVRSMVNSLKSGSCLAVDQSFLRPSCPNNVVLEAICSDENQEPGNLLLCQTSSPEVSLPVISREPEHVNGKSHPDSSVTFSVQLKSEPLEENMVKSIYETNITVQYSTDILCYPDSVAATCSSMSAPCLHEATSPDNPSPGRCRSQQQQEGSCRYSDEACISGSRLLSSVEGLLQHNDNNNPSDTVPSVFPLEVKVEPLEESNTDMPEKIPVELSSPFAETDLNSNKKLHSLVLSSCSIKPKLESMESGLLGPPSILPEIDIPRPIVKGECIDDLTTDFIDHIPLSERMQMLTSTCVTNLSCERKGKRPARTHRDANLDNALQTQQPPECGSSDTTNAKTKRMSLRRKRKKTATDSVETALEEDAPGLLQVLLDKGISAEEIKLYGDVEDKEALPSSSLEDSFEELETVIAKLFSEGPSIFKFPSVRQIKGSKAVYCLACLISLIEQTRYLRFRQSPVEWGWCRDLQSFIFVFERHNRIVLERPEYGYATYFFELVGSLPIDWQIKRLVTAMKLPCCSRTILLENKPLLVGEDLTEGEACVMEEYGWTRNSGLGTMLNYCERVVHDKKNEKYSFEWRAKIGKLLMKGHDSGRTVLYNLPKKAAHHVEFQDPEVKLET